MEIIIILCIVFISTSFSATITNNTTSVTRLPPVTSISLNAFGGGTETDKEDQILLTKTFLKSLQKSPKYTANVKGKGKRGEGDEEEVDEESDDVAENIRLGILPEMSDDDGMFAYIRKAAPSVLKIVKGAIARNETAMRDLFVLLAYEAASILP